MNTNFDAFENDLRALRRRELPPEWRADILRAAQSASRTPRWLVAGWSIAWAAIWVMYLTTPAEPDTPPSTAHETPTLRWEERAALIENLLAAN
ncbi:MAG TPA: hypothetical protein DDZ88_02435 [Verrucomicrobiales bacterium]|nr:hypothetical protein [Verrucomicrobiales bacterium]